ncbi:HAD family hydrolase [Streptantibioticus silvisoli]|uniref:HAD family hydrolase n=1 Tax=Streptantibioticus silvisoli TaxID=2705255 RepID=A0ABT6W018_9ACTN|nr:HAD family hydrolase [Streptantibioticus silvisoli]MDI5964093.1 HAD family hydrolase [Streptantibioticus silvisoli]
MHARRPDRNAPAPLLAPGSALVLFDLDGVLVDTLPVMRSAWQAVRAEHGVDVAFESYAQHLGRPFSDIMASLSVEQVEEVAHTYGGVSVRDAHLARPFPGIEAALRDITADGHRIGVVTSKPLERAVPLLGRLGCPFAVVRTPTRERGKPAPDTLLAALVETGSDPADALYVGDMAVDQEAARRADVRYVHAGWGYGEPAEPKPAIVHEPAELVRLLRVSSCPAATA